MPEGKLRSDLEQLGWFEGFSPDLIKATEDSIRWSVTHGYDALSPPAVIFMDLESVDYFEEPYRQLLQEFASNSYGLLQPTNIKEEYTGNSTTIGDFILTFENNGREYEVVIPHNSDWVSGEFFNLLDQLLADSGSDLRFIEITRYAENFSQEVVFILANPNLVEQAVESGLVIPYQYINDEGWYPREPGEFFP